MRILYISELNPDMKSGGAVAERRNFNCLKANFDVEVAKVYTTQRSKCAKIKDLVFSEIPVIYSHRQVKELKKIIKNTTAEIVFFETSSLGHLVKYAKRKGKKVICYLHNCEYSLAVQVRNRLIWKFIKKQEKQSVKYADLLIFLNQRDINEINRYYPTIELRNTAIIPITMKDIVADSDIEAMKMKKKGNRGLFIGSLFAPNYNGIKWFVENVADKIYGQIDIVGHNFENCQELKRQNVNVVGTVDDISKYFIEADYVVFPIFQGSGMKVKTCEALMYGKKIFATDEALDGYKKTEGVFINCNTAEEFIESINSYLANDEPVFNDKARILFETEYSNKASNKLFADAIFNALDLKCCELLI